MRDDSEAVTTVTIFNQTYQVRGSEDPEYVRELARYVDSKMSDVARSTPTVDSHRVAVLAALNIADAYLKAKREMGRMEADVRERADRLVTLLEPFRGEAP